MQEDLDYEVEAICGYRVVNDVVQYRVRWKGYDKESDTWESEDNLNCDILIREYWDSKSKKPIEKESIEEDPKRITILGTKMHNGEIVYVTTYGYQDTHVMTRNQLFNQYFEEFLEYLTMSLKSPD